MTFVEQQNKLKDIILQSFENQFGPLDKNEERSILFNRLEKDSILSVTVFTNKTSDNVRIRFDVTKIGNYTSVGPFALQAKVNFSAGTPSDEIFVAKGEVSRLEFPDVFNYLQSSEFQQFQATAPKIALKNGGSLLLQSGFPLKTQR